jgi:DNA-3-methyladenine glycosylase
VTPLDRLTQSAATDGSRRSAHPLPISFYDRPAEEVARELLGCIIVSTIGDALCSGEVVETEAYVGPHDEACHAHERFGRTRRNSVMFGPPGIAYVYLIYGMHWCLNAVTGPENYPAAVLIRALKPLDGLDTIRARRPGRPDRDLMRGPGNLCRALGVSDAENGLTLLEHPLIFLPGTAYADEEVVIGPRIGITRAIDWPLRFSVLGSQYVSR